MLRFDLKIVSVFLTARWGVSFVFCFFFCCVSLLAQKDSNITLNDQQCVMTLTPEEKKFIVARDLKNSSYTAKNMVRKVPLKIHIVQRSNGTGGVNPALIAADIARANNLFASANFQFFQCGSINYIPNNTYYNLIEFSFNPNSNEHKMANANKVPNVLNVFYCPNTIPNASWSSFSNWKNFYGKDWIIMRNGHANLQSIFTHEVGHWFDLYHTFETFNGKENVTRNASSPCFNCPTQGDLLCDTPADPGGFILGCSYNGGSVGSCGLPYSPSPSNIMAYTDCRSHFTPGQISRMKSSYDLYRKEIHNNNCSGCNPPTTAQNTTTNITQTTARLNCSASGTYRDFKYRKTGTTAWIQLNHTTANFINVSGLTASTVYQWASRRYCSGTWGGWSLIESFTTAGSGCSKPTTAQNTTTNIASSTARLNCSASGTYRDFIYRKTGTTTWTQVNHTTASFINISGLTASTAYQWASRRYCSGTWSGWSLAETFTTAAGGCSKPTTAQNTTTNITSSTARLNCSASGTYRDFKYRKIGTTGWIQLNHTTASFINISGLTPSTAYQWASRRYCSGTWGGWSLVDVFTTAGGGCSAPTTAQNTTTNITQTTARLNCSASGIYRHFKYRKIGTSTWIHVTQTTANHKNISGLTPSTAYQWASRRYCSNAWGGWSLVDAFTTAGGFMKTDMEAEKILEPEEQTTITMAPNPQKVGLPSTLLIESANQEESVLSIRDISGKTMLRKDVCIEEGMNQIRLNQFNTPGIYLISIQTASEIVTSKLFIVE